MGFQNGMKDEQKSMTQLAQELADLRRRNAILEESLRVGRGKLSAVGAPFGGNDGENLAEQAMRESEARYRGLVNLSPDAILSSDSDGRILFINPAGATLLGAVSADEITGKTLYDFIIPEQHEHVNLRLVWEEKSRRPRASQFKIRRLDGSTVDVEVNSLLITSQAEPELFSIARDISQRVQQEYEQAALLEMEERLRQARSRAEMISHLLDHSQRLADAQGAALAVRPPYQPLAEVEQAAGDLSGWVGQKIDCETGLLGRVCTEGQAYLSSGPESGCFPVGVEIKEPRPALLAVPLKDRDQVLGILLLNRSAPFQEELAQAVSAVASLAGSAIQRATLLEQTEQRLQRLTALHAVDLAITASLDLRVTLDVILDQVLTHLHVDAAEVLLINRFDQSLEYAASRGFLGQGHQRTHMQVGSSLASQAVVERKPLYVPRIDDYPDEFTRWAGPVNEGFVSYVVVPLIAKGEVVGVLEVFHRNLFTGDHEWQNFLEALAAQAAVAIDSARLFDNLQRTNFELSLAYDTTLEGWVRALELRDADTEGHTQRVIQMTIDLASAMGVPESDLIHVRRGALLHDIGKMGIPDEILRKPGPLTETEWKIMRQHPVLAHKLLASIPFLRPALDIPYCHHENWDGSGYPRGLRGEEIPLPARIFAIVDVWDALRSDRPYRRAYPDRAVLKFIRESKGRQFDPAVADRFVALVQDITQRRTGTLSGDSAVDAR